MAAKKANLIFGRLLTGAIVTSFLQTSLTTALPQIMHELSISASIAQWLTSTFSLTMAIMVPTSAYLIRRFTTRQIFLAAMMLFATGTLVSWWGRSFVHLLVGRVFQALGSGIILPLTQVVILTLYPKEKQGTVMGILGLAAGIAPVIAPTFTGMVIDSWGWRSIFLVTGLISIIIIILAFLTVKNVTPTAEIPLDYLSLLLCSGGLIGLLIGLSSLDSNISASVITLLIGITLIALFTKRQL